MKNNFPVLMLVLIGLDYRFNRISSGVPSFTVVEFFSYIGILCAASNIKFVSDVFKNTIKIAPFHVCFFAWALFVASINFLKNTHASSISDYKNLLPSFVIFSAIILSDNKKSIYVMLLSIVACYAVNVIMGIMQGHFNFPRPVELSEVSYYKMSMDGVDFGKNFASGWFNHPNAFSVFLMPAIPLFFYLAFSFDKNIYANKFLFKLLFSASIYCMYLTQGKGALIWAVYSVAIFIVAININKFMFYISLLGTLLSVSCVILYAVWDADVNVVSSTMITRIQLWDSAFEAIKERPDILIFGNAVEPMLGLSWSFTGGQLSYQNSHNGWINVMLTWGLPGFIFYVVAYVHALKILFTIDKLSNMYYLSRMIASVLLGLMAEYFYEPTTEGVTLQAQIFSLMAFGFLIKKFDRT